MHQTTQPDLDAVRAPKLLLANQDMEAPRPIPYMSTHMFSKTVLFYPVYLHVAEGPPVPAGEDGETVAGGERVGEERGCVREGSGLAPGGGDAGVVHPAVEELGVGEAFGEVGEGREGGDADGIWS